MPIHHTFSTTCAPCESPIARMVAEQSVPAKNSSPIFSTRRYILDAPFTPPKDTSDAAGLITLAKTCREIIADGTVTADEAGALKRWLQAAGWLKNFWPANAIAERINRMLEPLPIQKN